MSTRLKRNAVVVTMAVLVCAAAALNWKYAGQEAVEDAQNAGTKILGEAALVSGTEDGEDTPAASPEDESGVYTGSDYFASARLTRQQARDSAISLLQEAAAQENADAAVANEASESIQVLASFTLKEAQIENLVTAKGYADCISFISDAGVSVVVSATENGLQSADVARITEIVTGETGVPASQITIIEAQG